MCVSGRMSSECPVCRLFYLALNKHLKHKHAVRNLEERGILLKIASGRINVRTKPCPIAGCSYAGKRLDRHVKHDHPELSRHKAHQVMARLKHSVALQLLHDLRETNPIIGMATSLDIDNEEEYPGHPPPFSPHTECDNEDCRQVMLENVALRAQKDALNDEVKTLRSRLKKELKPRKQSAAVLEEEDECIRFKGLAIPNTSGINTVASGSNTPVKSPVKTVMQSPVTSGSETPVRSPVKTVMLAVASGGKRPVKNPVKSPMKTVMLAVASGGKRPVKNPVKSPVKTVILPVSSGSETPEKSPVKTVMFAVASGSETPVKTPVKTVMFAVASGSETPVKTPVETVMFAVASGSETPVKTPVETVMFAVASGSETPVCRKTRASKLANDLPSPSNYWSTGCGRGNTMREITLPRSMEAYLQTYLDHCLGVAPTVKQKDNVVSKISRIKNFIVYMAHGVNRLSDWLFLRNMKMIRGWSEYIVKPGRAVTTSEFFLKNVHQFMGYMSESKPRGCKLTQSDMTHIMREVKANMKHLNKAVTLHQFKVKRNKLDRLPSQAELLAAMAAAEKRIPELLDLMAGTPTSTTQKLLYGYLTLHWSLLYGHRTGVYANMKNSEVLEAAIRGTAEGYIIHVQDHKTAKTYGEAQLALTVEEFSWVMRWMGIKEALLGPQNEFFLFTRGNRASKNLNAHLKRAWADAGLETAVTFTILRTALADNIKHHQDPESRSILARFMCHDVTTADRFYANAPGIKEALRIRSMFRASSDAAAAASSSEGCLPLSDGETSEEGCYNSTALSSSPDGSLERQQQRKRKREGKRPMKSGPGLVDTPDDGAGAVDSTCLPWCTVRIRRLIWSPESR